MTHGIQPLETLHNRDKIVLNTWAHAWFDPLHDLNIRDGQNVEDIARYQAAAGYIGNLMHRKPGLRQSDEYDVLQTLSELRMLGAPEPFAEKRPKELTRGEKATRRDWLTRRKGALLTARNIVAFTLGEVENEARARELQVHADEAENTATHDQLTGIHNRRGLYKGAAEILAGIDNGTYSAAAVLVIDVDQFKSINDSLGHDKGDAALEMIASIIDRRTRRPRPGRIGDVVARVATKDEPELFEGKVGKAVVARHGGDEFVVVFPFEDTSRIHPSRLSSITEKAGDQGIGTEHHVTLPDGRSEEQKLTHEERTAVVVDRLKEDLTTALVEFTGGTVPGVGVSIGTSMLYSAEGVSTETVQERVDDAIHKADREMFKQKRNGRGQLPVDEGIPVIQPTPRYV